MNRRGIILAGGKGTRLYPTTISIAKALLPVYDKPMIYYSVSTLMLAGIREILVITSPVDKERIKTLLGDGKQWGIKIVYEVQHQPNGIADALIIAKEFLDNHPCALMLADNIFHGPELQSKLANACSSKKNTIFAYEVPDPERFGICELDDTGKVVSIEEKPSSPKSSLCVTGIYFYDEHAYQIASSIVPSPRGELEITDVNLVYMKQENLFAEILDQKYTWMDAGTVESFLEASLFVRSIEQESNIKISCPEEIAFNNKWINEDEVKMIAEDLSSSPYGDYLLKKIKN
jgi:glucose-1-phosphate thymidylyltransferase